MKKKNFKRIVALALAAVMTIPAMGNFATVQAADAQTQMTSEKEVVYANIYSNTARELDFDSNWKFYLGEASGAEANAFDDSAWENVNVPHDYSIEQEYTSAGEAESAYLLGGTGWYRKHFTLNSDLEGKEIRIDFGGVYMNATVWVNGTKLGTHPFGYTPFSFNITDYVTFEGENVITVKVDHKTPSSRWYSGSGIYRSVNLTVTDPVHVDLFGTKISTPNLEKEQNGTVNMTVKTTVVNAGSAAKNVVLTHTIYEKGTENAIGTVTTAAQSVAAGASKEISATLPAANPKLWDTKNPNLYTVVTDVKVGNDVVDTYETEYGFRYIKFDTNTGFYLNGEKTKLKGVCMHHDQGSLGSEAHYRAIERQVEILKEMGCNSIRVTHNPAADELIEVCNEKGILVIDEFFDGWHLPKNGNYNDYSVWFRKAIETGNTIIGAESGMTWAEFDMKATIGRGENAPSVIMWSLGNEIQEGAGGSGYAAIADELITWAQEKETTKLLTIGSNAVKNGIGNPSNEHVQIANKLTAVGGVSGTNYSNGSSYDSMHSAYPNWFIYGSETASHVNSRGVYNVTGSQQLNADKALTSYDYSAVGWGATASAAWYDVITRDFVAGEYVWTGFDYMGEPTPNNGTDAGFKNGSDSPKNSFFGIIDTAGLPKDNYYFYQSQWNDEVNTLHVLPAWNRDVLANPNNVPVVVYSDAASVKLTLTTADGTVKDLGTKTFVEKTTEAGYKYQMASANSTNSRDLYFTWNVPFEAGTLKATAYDKAGNEIKNTVGRSFVTTTGDEAKLNATVDRATIDADGKDLAYITVDVTDANGNIVPDAKNNVTFTVEGNGVLVGVDNGKQSDHQSFQDDNRNAFNGSLIAIVQSTKEAGEFTVTATAAGLQSDSVTVKTESAGATGDVSFFMSKNYYVKVGNAPQLPTTIETTLADGTTKELPVVWNKIDAADYAQAGTFAVAGVVDGKYAVSVTINMIDEVGGLLNYSTTTSVGLEPSLPAARPAVLVDGTVLDATFPVTWDKIDAADCAKAGTFVVDGSANVFGQEVEVTASIRVQEVDVTAGDSISNQAVKLYQDIAEDLQSDTLAAVIDGSTIIGANNDGGANETAWSNYDASQAGIKTAEITLGYDTQQRFAEIVIHFWKDGYSAEFPDAGTTKIYMSETGNEGSWVEVEAAESIGTEKDRVKPYTYTFEPFTATYVKVAVANSSAQKTAKTCTGITEIELKKAVSGDITANSSTGFETLKVNGTALNAAELATGSYYTLDKAATVQATGKENAAVTVLPVYKKQVKIITESEDHTKQEVFVIYLEKETPREPSYAGSDVDKSAYTYKTGSAQPQSGSEGPIAFAFDGNESTYWHSEWTPSWPAADFAKYLWVEFDLKEATVVDAIRYLARGGNGDITGYRVEGKLTADGEWTVLTEGTWSRDGQVWHLAEFDAVEVVALRLVCTSTYADSGNNRFASARELAVRGAKLAVTVDKAELAKAIEAAEKLEKDDYTAETWADFEEALEAAKAVNNAAATTQAAVDKALEDLEAAQKALEKKAAPVDKAELAKAIEAAEKLEKDDYTAETWADFEEALEAAKEVNNAAATTQEAVDKALADLTSAQDALEEKPAPVVNPFEDVKEADYYYTPVLWAVEKGITTGTSATTFSPEDTCTRGAVVTFLWRAAGCPEPKAKTTSFVDVTAADYYYKAVLWAVEEGITTGTSATTFAPNDGCTRGQVVTFLFRASGEKAPAAATNAFSDVVKGAYYEKAVLWAVDKGITTGTSATTFEPDSNCTRGQIVTFIYRSEK